MKAGVCWTGGKDCNLALYEALLDGHVSDVDFLIVFRPKGDSKFLAHPLEVMQAQAESLHKQLIQIIIEDPYKDSYVKGLIDLKEQHGVQAVITGDMEACFGPGEHIDWMTDCCAQAGMTLIRPLWKIDRLECLERLMKLQFQVIFSCVKSPFFDEKWCGKELCDPEAISALQEKRRLHGLDLCGENGEYHTMVLSGPLYSKPVQFSKDNDNVKVVELEHQPGQQHDQQWWVLQTVE
eukprot:TRINITY_DN4139_c0_g2_i1.p1 TRINITY_DN4139_c0_g2~~TRINITY_DN4139_c0_g2_i1.p1  ORF type:complete len:237 (-),score=51.31 TRINITY_DN4139_c0_g2_i1:135-845(-)